MMGLAEECLSEGLRGACCRRCEMHSKGVLGHGVAQGWKAFGI